MKSTVYHIAQYGFEAARQTQEAGHHGHSFWVTALGDLGVDEQLQEAVKTFDYRCLNDTLGAVDDLSIAKKMREFVSAAHELKIRSAPNQGVLLSEQSEWTWVSQSFQAAHFLPNVPEGHKCGRLHGHGFEVTLFASNCTASELRALWLPIYERFNHRLLNDIEGLENPTSEQLAAWIWQRLNTQGVEVVHVKETATAGCAFDGAAHRIWKQQDAECALYLPNQSSPTGCSYHLRLHITGQLDTVMGWAMDYGDVKALFKPYYQQIDHHCLDDFINTDSSHADSLDLLHWMDTQLSSDLSSLSQIEVYESSHRGWLLNKVASTVPHLVHGN